jgi:hypothetical protein
LDPSALAAEGGDQGCRRADQQVGLAGQGACAGDHGLELGQGGLSPFIFQLPAISGRRASVSCVSRKCQRL